MRGTGVPLAFLCLAAVPAVGACALSDEVGGGEVVFDMPFDPKAPFIINTSDPRWRPTPRNGLPEVTCGGTVALSPDCCHLPASMGLDCQVYPLACVNQRCALVFDYEDIIEINIGDKVDVLQDRRNWVLAKASLDAFEFTISHGSSGLPMELRLYVAPQGADSAKTSGASFLVNIPLISSSPSTKSSPEAQVLPPISETLSSEAQAALSAFLLDFNTPFSLILSAHVEVKPGVVPSGEVRVGLSGRVHASF